MSLYTREHLSKQHSAAEWLRMAEQDPRLLLLLDDHSARASKKEAFEFIAYGYGRKVGFEKLSLEFVQQHANDLLLSTALETIPLDAALLDVLPGDYSPTITPWSLRVGCCHDGSIAYAQRCSTAFRAEWERITTRKHAFSLVGDRVFGRIYELRDAAPDALMGFLSEYWYSNRNMEKTHQVIDWLVERNELIVLASCFGQTEHCDPYIALATRVPDALKYLHPRCVSCESNTVRDLFVMHGQGRKLSESVLEPDFAVRHWDEVGPVGGEWFGKKWKRILVEAGELPKSPIPMFLLRELAAIVEPAKLEAHLDHVTAYCQGYDDYRTMYERLA